MEERTLQGRKEGENRNDVEDKRVGAFRGGCGRYQWFKSRAWREFRDAGRGTQALKPDQ